MMRFELEPKVVAWVDRQPVGELFTTSISASEIQSGIERTPASRKRRLLQERFDDILDQVVGGRVLQFGREQGDVAARVQIHSGAAKSGDDTPDTLIAALAKQQRAALATHNVEHFCGLGLTMLDPWST